ncbi:MAG: PAS/PAC sensor hybrid histidine [Bacteroidetes bacterium]|nr:MAG: PAS/PAC sensor hybrid histidine [Bacteroidota bacterium]
MFNFVIIGNSALDFHSHQQIMGKIPEKVGSKSNIPELQKFRNVLDLNKIQHLQDKFSVANGLSVAIVDIEGNLISFSGNNKRFFNEIVNQPDQMSGLITLISDELASQPMIRNEHPLGLVEAVGRIMVGDVYSGNWWIGLIRTAETDRNEADQFAAKSGLDAEPFFNDLMSLPLMPYDQFVKMIDLWIVFITELSEWAYNDIILNAEIENRKKTNALLKESENRFQLLFNKAPIGYQSLDADGNILEVNQQWLDLLGYTAGEVRGKWFGDFLSENYKNAFRERFPLFKAQGFIHSEFEMVHKNRSHLFIAFEGKIGYDSKGRFKQTHCVLQDITESRESKQKLVESEEKYRMLLESSGIGVAVYSPEGEILLLNRKAAENLGGIIEDFKGKFLHDLFQKDLADDFLKRIKAALNTESSLEYEDFVNLKSGSYWFLSNHTRIRNADGQIIGVQALAHDITERKKFDKELHVERQLLRTLIDNIPDSIYTKDVEYRKTLANKAEIKFMGAASEDEVIGKTDFDFYPKELAEEFLKDDQLVIEHGQVILNREEYVLDINGNKRWLLSSKLPLKDKDNQVIGLVGIGRDITYRKNAEDELHKSFDLLYKLTDQVPGVVYQYRLWPDGHSCFPIASRGMYEIYEVTPEEVKDDATIVFSRIHPEDVNSVIDSINESAQNLTLYHSDFRVILPKQGMGWRSCDARPERMNDGSTLWYGIITDVTERKKSEESLMQFRTVVEKSKVSILITDSNGSIEYANPFFTQLTGYTAQDYLGKNPKILNSGYHTADFYQELWNTIKSGNTWEGELKNKKRSGEIFWENAIITPIVNSKNEITHFVAVKTDITHTKKVHNELIVAKERAIESERLKSAFLANMSHEIRTPMNGILGFTDLLRTPGLSGKEQDEYIQIIQKSGDRMLNIINDIINISMIESGQVKVNYLNTNLNEQIEFIEKFFRPEIEAKGLKLFSQASLPDNEVTISTDREKVYAILTNLVKNAIKFTNNGYIRLGYTKKMDYLEVFVEDTGYGISDDKKDLIFERFRQGSEELTRNFEGAGLGLSISRAYAEMIGGSLWLESEVGKGSTFYCTIPIVPIKGGEESKLKVVSADEKPAGDKKIKALVVDDDEISDKLITIPLSKICYQILHAVNGKEAVDICRDTSDLDLILIDLKMPEMDGFEAIRLIREFNKSVVIIAQTAYAQISDKEKALAAGSNDYISKPIDRKLLMEIIKKYIQY